MSTDQIVLLFAGLLVIAAVAVTVAYATAYVVRSDPADEPPGLAARGRREHEDADADQTASGPSGVRATRWISPASTRQVARVVAFLFLAAVAVVVALTRAWQETEAAIFTLLAAGMLLVVLFMDMIPPAALGRWRRPAEGIGAVVFLGLLMTLTGGASSPFLVGFFLVVAGTALSAEGRAPLAVALVGAATIALVGLVDAVDGAPAPQALAWLGISAVALVLLADIATATARAQRHARDEALRASRFDALTGLYNRAFFFTTMEQEIRRSDRMGRGFTMLMLDLDDLKPVNDTFGHQWGDRLLKAVADTIRRTVRFTDAAARYGGDEFVVLLPETDAAGGYVVGEKLRRDIAALTLHAADRNVRSSVSVGLVTYPDDGSTIEQLVAAADVAMYESKRRGKNRIVGYQTRTERVATAIDDTADAGLVQLTPAADVRTGGDPAPWEGRRDRSSIPVQPEPGPPAWSTGSGTRSTPAARTPEPERRRPTADPEGGSDAPSARAGALLPFSDAGSEDPGSVAGDSDVVEPAWLTRTNGSAAAPPPVTGLDASDAVRRSSRSDEVRTSGERPWIALPIEPNDPPDRPSGPRR